MSGSVVRVVLPAPLRALSGAGAEIAVAVPAPVTLRVVLDAVEGAFPSLRGTMRDHVTQQRRAFVRFYACEMDLSLDSPDVLLPERVTAGLEPLLVVGAMAGG